MKLAAITILVGMGLLVSSPKVLAFQMEDREDITKAIHEVNERTAPLCKWAEPRVHKGNHKEKDALNKLHIFADRASHFYQQVKSWDGNDSPLRKSFSQLQEDWNRVQETFPNFHPDKHTQNDYEIVLNQMRRLNIMAEKKPIQRPKSHDRDSGRDNDDQNPEQHHHNDYPNSDRDYNNQYQERQNDYQNSQRNYYDDQNVNRNYENQNPGYNYYQNPNRGYDNQYQERQNDYQNSQRNYYDDQNVNRDYENQNPGYNTDQNPNRDHDNQYPGRNY